MYIWFPYNGKINSWEETVGIPTSLLSLSLLLLLLLPAITVQNSLYVVAMGPFVP